MSSRSESNDVASADDLFNIEVAFLEAAQDALNLANGAPARAFVCDGQPPLDCCEQLTVWSELIDTAGMADRGGPLGGMKAINRGDQIRVLLNIQVSRCRPEPKASGRTLDLPTPTQMQASARFVDSDGWALWLGMADALKHGDLAETCSGAERLGMRKMIPQGGCVGWVVQYRYPIEGGRIGTGT